LRNRWWWFSEFFQTSIEIRGIFTLQIDRFFFFFSLKDEREIVAQQNDGGLRYGANRGNREILAKIEFLMSLPSLDLAM
jgi:hypothetical protein